MYELIMDQEFMDQELMDRDLMYNDQQNQMNTWTINEILSATQGELMWPAAFDALFNGFSIDSRAINTEELFIAIKGERHDGHGFIDQVVKKHIQGIIIEKNKLDNLPEDLKGRRDIVCIGVKDTIKALGALASFHRQRIGLSIVAITGSNGKTTTKEMTGKIVSSHFPTIVTAGNFNNEIGLPLSLLKATKTHKWAVLELGMNHPGEINRLADICKPKIGIITNVGPVHLEGVNDIDGVARAKGELLAHIDPGGYALLNADDVRVAGLASKCNAATLLFGTSPNAQIQAMDVHPRDIGYEFKIQFKDQHIDVQLNRPGAFMISNALAAAGVGMLLQIPAKKIKHNIESVLPIKGRMNLLPQQSGIQIIDDTYNANPASMKASIKTFCELKKDHRGFVVIGDMFELGTQSADLHREIGSFAAQLPVSKLFVTGQFAGQVARGARDKNMDDKSIVTGTKPELVDELKQQITPGDWILVKGSRGMAMETIVLELTEWMRDIKPNLKTTVKK